MRTFLWTASSNRIPIDDFVGQSPNGRYASYVEGKHLFVFDAKSEQILDLTLADAIIDDSDNWKVSGRTQIAFSFGNVAAFRRQHGAATQLVAIDLETREQSVLHETSEDIYQFWFDDDARHFVVTQRPPRRKRSRPAATPRSRTQRIAHCGESLGCFHAEPKNTSGVMVERISIESLNDEEEREESLQVNSDCFADSRAVIVHSSLGGWLVGFQVAPNDESDFQTFGPVQWVSSLIPPDHRNCPNYKRPQSWERSVRPVGHPQGSAGLNVDTGLWYFDPQSLNRTLQQQGYSTTGVAHAAYGGELFVGWRRYRGTLSVLGVNSKDVSRWREPGARTSIGGVAIGLSSAYSAWRRGRVSFMPEFGLRMQALEIKTPREVPAVAVQSRGDLPNPLKFESAALMLDFALRTEVRLLRLDRSRDSFTYLTLGSYLGWEQQVISGGWNLTETETKVNVAEPRVNRTGPLGLLYIGFLFERF